MSSIINNGDTFHGTGVFGRGVFTHDEDGRTWTFAGQYKDGYACGLGVLTSPDGDKVYAEHGPDGKCDGRRLERYVHGLTWYYLVERGGKLKDSARVSANGRCMYNWEDCAPDDPRLLALIAQVAPVEVRPAAQAPHPPSARHSDPTQSSDGSAGSFCPRRRWRRPRPPRCTPTPHAVAGGRAAQPSSSRTVPRDRFHPEPACRALQFSINPVWVWQAEEAVANLPLRLAVRVHCGHRVRRGTLGVLKRPLRAAH
jgi:hypothetical protein